MRNFFDAIPVFAPFIAVLAVSLMFFNPYMRMQFAPNLWCDYEEKATNQKFIENYKEANISYLMLEPGDRYLSVSGDTTKYLCTDIGNSVSNLDDVILFFSLVEDNKLQLTIMNGGNLFERVNKNQFFSDTESLLSKCLEDVNAIKSKKEQIKSSWEK